MLKFIIHHLFKDISIENRDLFYDIYKYEYSIPFILRFRYLIYSLSLYLISIPFLIIFKTHLFGTILIIISMFLIIANLYENNKKKRPYYIVTKFDFKIRSIRLEEKIRTIITKANHNVLSRNDWTKIKSFDLGLYNDILSDESIGLCYYYSREIGLIIKDVDLIWCSISDPFNKDKCYAHAIIKKNEYIYDTNLRMSYKFTDYAKLYNLKIFKEWSYDQYSNENFSLNIRKDFRNWCIQNGVSKYKNF